MGEMYFRTKDKQVANIAARDAIVNPSNGLMVKVLDASGDPNISSGNWAIYRRIDNEWVIIEDEANASRKLKTDEILLSNKIGDPGNLENLTDLINIYGSAGVISGANISDNNNGTVNISSGYGLLRPTASSTATLYAVNFNGQNNLHLLPNVTNYIYIDYNNGIPMFATTSSSSDFNCMNKCVVYLATLYGSVVSWVDLREQNVDLSTKIRRMLLEKEKFTAVQGGSVLGSNGLAITVTAGGFYYMLRKTPHIAFNTSIAGANNSNIFTLYYRNGSGGWINITESKVINTAKFDNGSGTLANIGYNQYGVCWVYVINSSPSTLAVVVGQAEYRSLASAEKAQVPSDIPPQIAVLGALVGFVAFRKNATSFESILSSLTQRFTATTAAAHNGLSGIQGGNIDQYYHLTSGELNNLNTTVTEVASHIGSGGSSHAIATTSVNGYMSAEDKVKLDALASMFLN